MVAQVPVPRAFLIAGLSMYGLSMILPWAFETEAAFFGHMFGAYLPLAWTVGFALMFAASTAGLNTRPWGIVMAWACTICLVVFAMFPLAINGDGVDLSRRFGLFVALLGSATVAVGLTWSGVADDSPRPANA
ncbi:MAG: hypothetical protein AABY18_07495 [Candidatus Thermoplasmatota archaeon]